MMEQGATTREMIGWLLERFGQIDPLERGEMSPDESARFNYLRDLFIAAGAQRIEEEANPERWLQVGLSFARRSDAISFLQDELADQIEQWRASDAIHSHAWLYKPPGVRLRFCGRALSRRFQTELFGLLNQAKSAGKIENYELGTYTCETYQFGGEVGMRICHDYFSDDSQAVMRLHGLRTRRESTTAPEILSLLALNDLIRKCVLDPWEHWDVWCNMRLARRGLDLPDDARELAQRDLERHRDLWNALVFSPERVCSSLSEQELCWLERYQAENTKLVAAFQKAEREGCLLYGVRQILPFCIIFHWNRLGIAAAEQKVLSFLMQSVLDPKRS
jgi:thiopeptide-type bacteriocin biosynthesis protein